MQGCLPNDARRWETAAVDAFGPPAQTYTVDGVQVLVWKHNLLSDQLPRLPMNRPGAC